MLGIGIIGCGTIATQRHAPEYAHNKACKLVGMYDSDFARAQKLAAVYGVKAFATLDELLGNKDIGAVSVCTSNDTHASISIAALYAQKHVLCEKPMATTAKDAQKMIDAAQHSEKILMVAQNQRLDPVHILAKKVLNSGELGKVLSFQAAFSHSGPENWLKQKTQENIWFFRSSQSGFGVLSDLGIHKIDLLCWLLNDDVKDVCAFSATLDKHLENGEPIDVEDNAAILLRFYAGVVGTILCSWTSYGAEDNATVLNCQHGVLRMYRDGEALSVIHADGTVQDYPVKRFDTPDASVSSGVIDLFIEGIHMKKSPISGEDGLRAIRIVERCFDTQLLE